jgi:hypothetical protein
MNQTKNKRGKIRNLSIPIPITENNTTLDSSPPSTDCNQISDAEQEQQNIHAIFVLLNLTEIQPVKESVPKMEESKKILERVGKVK